MLTVIKLPEILNILIPLCGAKQNTLTYCFTGSAMHVAISIIISCLCYTSVQRISPIATYTVAGLVCYGLL